VYLYPKNISELLKGIGTFELSKIIETTERIKSLQTALPSAPKKNTEREFSKMG